MLHKNTLLFAALSAALRGSATQTANAAVVASLKPLGSIASTIADGVTDAKILLPDGAPEHDYSLCPSDVECLQGADLVVWVGSEMRVFVEGSVKNILNAKQATIAQLNDMKLLLMKGADDDNDDHGHDDAGSEKNDERHHHGDYNMHLWFSLEIARALAIAIHEKLVELMPQSRVKLDANLKDSEIQLAVTDKQVGSGPVLSKGKGYFVFHDAYNCCEKRYELTPLDYLTVNSETQPDMQRLHEIGTQLVR